MNNMNKARIRTVWVTIGTMIITLLFGTTKSHAITAPTISYSSDVLYINKYINLVNIKDIINVDISKNKSNNIVYIIKDLKNKTTFIMPSYSKLLNLKTRVDKRVIISRLANGILSQETGGVGAYLRRSYSSSACGAFQYMAVTWDNFMGYKNPCDAPSWVQDLRMTSELKTSYEKYHDWKKAVAAHLSPARAENLKTWNEPIKGNPTVLQYVTSVFQKANIAL
jgi:hypothetical protein